MNFDTMKICKLLVGMIIFVSLSCSAQKNGVSYYQSNTEFLNTELDGSVTVRVCGVGRNRQDATEQAWKNALRDIIFNGVYIPGNTLLSKPILAEVNAEEKYSLFFDAFFSDRGEYLKFVSSEDTKRRSSKQYKNNVQNKVVVTVRILRPQLIQYLKDAEVLKLNK